MFLKYLAGKSKLIKEARPLSPLLKRFPSKQLRFYLKFGVGFPLKWHFFFGKGLGKYIIPEVLKEFPQPEVEDIL